MILALLTIYLLVSFKVPRKGSNLYNVKYFNLNKASINVQCRNKYLFFADEETYSTVSAFNNQYYNSKVYNNNHMWVGVKVFGLCF